MRSGRETRRLAALCWHKGSSMKKLITRCDVNRVTLYNDLIGDDYSAAVELMDSEVGLRGL